MKESVGTGVIYKYTSPSGKCYVGQTWNESKRKQDHRTTKSHCFAFRNAIKKYGSDNLIYEVLYYGIESQEVLDCLEIFEIENNNSLAPNGYNLSTGGMNCKRSEETKARMSEAQKGRKHSEETCRKIGEAHKRENLRKETLVKMSECKKGIKLTEKHKERIRQSNLGRTLTPEAIIALQAARIAKGISDETRARMSANNKGKKLSQETIQKMIKSRTGLKRTEETKRKLSESVRLSWIKRRESSNNT